MVPSSKMQQYYLSNKTLNILVGIFQHLHPGTACCSSCAEFSGATPLQHQGTSAFLLFTQNFLLGTENLIFKWTQEIIKSFFPIQKHQLISKFIFGVFFINKQLSQTLSSQLPSKFSHKCQNPLVLGLVLASWYWKGQVTYSRVMVLQRNTQLKASNTEILATAINVIMIKIF